jgi:hypothetical protein
MRRSPLPLGQGFREVLATKARMAGIVLQRRRAVNRLALPPIVPVVAKTARMFQDGARSRQPIGVVRPMQLMELDSAETLRRATGDEALKRLYDYWTERCSGKRLPARRDVDPLDFGYALGRVSLIDVVGEPRRFWYRLVSTQLTERLGYEMTGKPLEDIPDVEMRRYAERVYGAAVEKRVPLYFRDAPVLDGNRWESEALILPLSADGEAVDMLMIYRTTEGPKRG